jgi:hypothetical protein
LLSKFKYGDLKQQNLLSLWVILQLQVAVTHGRAFGEGRGDFKGERMIRVEVKWYHAS